MAGRPCVTNRLKISNHVLRRRIPAYRWGCCEVPSVNSIGLIAYFACGKVIYIDRNKTENLVSRRAVSAAGNFVMNILSYFDELSLLVEQYEHLLDRLPEQRVSPVRPDLGQRRQHEAALMHAGMGQG